jgi:arylsulfatase A-like enzyme
LNEKFKRRYQFGPETPEGMMVYKTPNIDRIARQGALFTDWYLTPAIEVTYAAKPAP